MTNEELAKIIKELEDFADKGEDICIEIAQVKCLLVLLKELAIYRVGKEEKETDERPTGKPCIVISEDMGNYCICPCCRKPIDRWDRYCKHCGAEMESKEE